MACHHRLWAAQTFERCRVWHDITALGLHARSDEIRRGMTSPPLDSTHGRRTSGVACHHRLWAAHTIEQRQAWNDITAFGQHIRSNDVGCERPSPPLDGTLGRMTSGVACRHHLRAVHTVKRRGAWHVVIAFGQHTRSNDVGRDMTSPPLGSTNIRKMSGVA